ncbi:unnamed protein product [Ceratitis capitata]|uniref:(Mediterranean fruit fly) hypothetical protein n=1 Tax=Ceratitis capitata TaxID=7213 RepID=A0A811U1I4_CERCA|nr:unnamed protein product [Ceratitis capitata]
MLIFFRTFICCRNSEWLEINKSKSCNINELPVVSDFFSISLKIFEYHLTLLDKVIEPFFYTFKSFDPSIKPVVLKVAKSGNMANRKIPPLKTLTWALSFLSVQFLPRFEFEGKALLSLRIM